jgi:uncharacterized DUF497 family protein
MDFEWDEEKRQEVLRARGIDFVLAADSFNDIGAFEDVDRRQEYGEVRTRRIGMARGVLVVVVYTMRGSSCRIITAWKAGPNDRKKYQALQHGRDPGDA